EKLQDQLSAAGAEELAQGDLAGSQGRSGGRQIHEIETGRQESEDADERHAIERAPAPGRGHVEFPMGGVEVHPREGGQVRFVYMAAQNVNAGDLRQLRRNVLV